jgi:hypothetical protein
MTRATNSDNILAHSERAERAVLFSILCDGEMALQPPHSAAGQQ